MGCLYAFKCEACEFQATISGGPDLGRVHKTTTIACDTCQDLFDVIVEEIDLSSDAFPWVPVSVRCPNEERAVAHQFELWSHPGGCPHCHAQMIRYETVMYFD